MVYFWESSRVCVPFPLLPLSILHLSPGASEEAGPLVSDVRGEEVIFC